MTMTANRIGLTPIAPESSFPLVPLKQMCEINPRRPPIASRSDSSPTSFVPMTAVDAQSGTIAERIERPFAEVRKGYTYFEDGDVIFAKITPCMQNGKHAICRDLLNGFGFGSTEFHVLRPHASLLAEWLHFFLRQPELLKDAQRHFTGAVGQQRLPEEYLRDLEIPLPPVDVQKALIKEIVAAFVSVESARRAAMEQLAAIEALPAAILKATFDGRAIIDG